MQKKVSRGPHAIHIEKRDDSRMLTAVRRLWGQVAGAPAGGGPVDGGQVAAHVVVRAENRGVGGAERFTLGISSHHAASSRRTDCDRSQSVDIPTLAAARGGGAR